MHLFFVQYMPQPATAHCQDCTCAPAEAMVAQKKNEWKKIPQPVSRRYRRVVRMKKTQRKKIPQPEPRRYRGVFWDGRLSGARGKWRAQITNPHGHEPRQQFVLGSLKEKQEDSAAVLAKVLKVEVKDLLMPTAAPTGVEKSTTQLYRGVIWREDCGGWVAQITRPKGCVPRQITVGGINPTQKQAAKAMIKKMTQLKMVRPNGEKTKWTLRDVKMKKAEVYRRRVAMNEQLEKFKIWSNEVGFCSRIAKKNKNPGWVLHFSECHTTSTGDSIASGTIINRCIM
jgi:hypothetical protein